jgi:hypothetical protein
MVLGHTIYPPAILFNELHYTLRATGLGASKLNVVVVVKQLCIRISCGGSFESDRNEGLSNHAVKGTLVPTIAPVFLESLVDDIPVLAFSFPVGHDVGDVGGHDRDHCLVVVDVAD